MSELNIDDFLQGQIDCMQGIEHKEGMSDSYNRGYTAQYEVEQMRNELYGHKEIKRTASN